MCSALFLPALHLLHISMHKENCNNAFCHTKSNLIIQSFVNIRSRYIATYWHCNVEKFFKNGYSRTAVTSVIEKLVIL